MLTREEAKKTLNKEYRGYIYNKIDGVIVSKIVTIEESIEFVDNGDWKLSPACFSDNEEMKEDPNFEAVASGIAQDFNVLLNLELIDDKVRLEELGKRLLDIDLHKNMKLETMRKRIKQAAKNRGVWPDDNSTNGDTESSK